MCRTERHGRRSRLGKSKRGGCWRGQLRYRRWGGTWARRRKRDWSRRRRSRTREIEGIFGRGRGGLGGGRGSARARCLVARSARRRRGRAGAIWRRRGCGRTFGGRDGGCCAGNFDRIAATRAASAFAGHVVRQRQLLPAASAFGLNHRDFNSVFCVNFVSQPLSHKLGKAPAL
jgi:hypothetical protein